ncbi:MAG: DUF2203 domain-containing protein [Chloroflexia bacterium]
MPKYYTLQEANLILPQLTELLGQLQALGRQKGMVDGRVAEVTAKVKGNGHHNPVEDPTVVQASQALTEALRAALRQLDDWEIELKDLSTGLVDFMALREGREVYLCWRLGEPEVGYWHELSTGFSGRLPVDENTR